MWKCRLCVDIVYMCLRAEIVYMRSFVRVSRFSGYSWLCFFMYEDLIC